MTGIAEPELELTRSKLAPAQVHTRFVQVAVPVPMHQFFDYELPPHFARDTPDENLVGCRVHVPFGFQKRIGIIVSVSNTPSSDFKTKPIFEVLDDTPLLSEHQLKLARWCSQYYFFPLGDTFAAMLPSLLRQGKASNSYQDKIWVITDLGDITNLEKLAKKSNVQHKALSLLREQRQLSQTLLGTLQIKRNTLEALEKAGFVSSQLQTSQSQAPSMGKRTSVQAALPPALTFEQQQAVDDIAANIGVHVLFGVTGSGKTEVYMQLITQALQQEKQVLVLVPEIGLTPQTLTRFQKRFAITIAVLHSQQTDSQRASQWLSAQSGTADLVIGTRSAIFTPLPRLGLIIIDEEHDPSYKQQEGMRYCARDLALLRAHWLGISVVLGSATPSLETLYNVKHKGFYQHTLKQRATGVALPDLKMVDLRRETTTQGMANTIFDLMERQLSQGQQVLVFLNRRGFAPAVICNDCGWSAACQHCDAKLTLHRSAGRMRCHHCEHSCAIPEACPMCGSAQVNPHGKGTERVEETLRERFSQPVIRIDRDTMPNQKTFEACLKQINTGEPLILLGTQMLSKGHDFHGVQLVVMLDVDAGLFSSDFRAEEQISQLLTQVAGRAGRAQAGGKVVVQTYQPHHAIFQHWYASDYTKTAEYLLEQRANAGMPPYAFQLLLRAESAQPAQAQTFLRTARTILQSANDEDVMLLGPFNASMERKAGVSRFSLLLQGTTRQMVHKLMRRCHHCLFEIPEARQVRWSLDVDPQEF